MFYQIIWYFIKHFVHYELYITIGNLIKFQDKYLAQKSLINLFLQTYKTLNRISLFDVIFPKIY